MDEKLEYHCGKPTKNELEKLSKQDAYYLGRIDQCLEDIRYFRRDSKRFDVEFRRREASSRKSLQETKSILCRLEKTLQHN